MTAVLSLPRTLATARRVLQQLRGDHRTLALLLLVPLVLLTLLRYVFDEQPAVFDRIGTFDPRYFGKGYRAVDFLLQREAGFGRYLLAKPAG